MKGIRRRHTFVYFIRELGEGGAIKIGRAFDPRSRLREIQCGNPRRLELVGFIPGDRSLEAEFHKHFSEWNVGGEWFSAAAPGLTEVAEAASHIGRAVDDGVDEIELALVQRFLMPFGAQPA